MVVGVTYQNQVMRIFPSFERLIVEGTGSLQVSHSNRHVCCQNAIIKLSHGQAGLSCAHLCHQHAQKCDRVTGG